MKSTGEYQRRPPKFLPFAVHEQMALKRATEILAKAKCKRCSKANYKKNKACHRVLRTVWFLVCSIGLIGHSWLTTTDYLEYLTTTEVQVYIPTRFRPPAASLCLMLNDAINVSKLDSDEQLLWKDNNCKLNLFQPCLDTLSKYGMVGIMNNLTYDLYHTNSNGHIQTSYYKKKMKCVKYVTDQDGSDDQMDVGDVDNMSVIEESILSTALPKQMEQANMTGVKVAIFLHDSQTLSHIREGNILWLSVDTNNYHLSTFDHVQSKYLPHPFRTECIDYVETQTASRGHCIERCYEAKYYNKNRFHSGLITTTNFTEAILPSKFDIPYSKAIDTLCDKMCPKKCLTLSYFSITVGDYDDGIIDTFFYHHVSLSRPFTKVTLMASFNMSQFIIFMASAAGLWFGCSLYVTITSMVTIVSNFSLEKHLS